MKDKSFNLSASLSLSRNKKSANFLAESCSNIALCTKGMVIIMKKNLAKRILAMLTMMPLAIGTLPPTAAEAATEYVALSQYQNIKADSFQSGYNNAYVPDRAFDGIENDAANCWHTPWDNSATGFPHWIQVEFKEPQAISSLVYCARSATQYQFVTSYEIQVSESGNEADLKTVALGTWSRAKTASAAFKPQSAKLVRFIAKGKVDTATTDTKSCSAAEIKIGLASDEQKSAMVSSALAAARRVAAYADEDDGTGSHQFSPQKLLTLQNAINALSAYSTATPWITAQAQLDAVKSAQAELLTSNVASGESVIVELPSVNMSASANTQAEGYEAQKAIDSDISTMWHSQWEPQVAHPHILEIDMGRSVLIDSVTITPRQDMKTGKITSGNIYIGDNLQSMGEAMPFTANSSYDATLVDANCGKGRYLRIESLQSNSQNTAIAKVIIKTYDRGYEAFLEAYELCKKARGKAVMGSDVGEYGESALNDMDNALAAAEALCENSSQYTNSAMYEKTEELEMAYSSFMSAKNIYTVNDLQAVISEAKSLESNVENAKDKALLHQMYTSSEAVLNSPSSTRIEIHESASELKKVIAALLHSNEDGVDLSGEWQLSLGEAQYRVTLPGTLDENEIGTPNSARDAKRLSRRYTYTGAAVYSRSVFIPNIWEEKRISLHMGRSRETRVWVNGTQIYSDETSNVLATEQRYDLTSALTYGEEAQITIEVDNSYPNLPAAAILASSMATEETQTNWNGIVGSLALVAEDKVCIDALRVYPNADLTSARIEADLVNLTPDSFTGTLTLQCASMEKKEVTAKVGANERTTITVSDYAMGADCLLWSEFEPNLYSMTASLSNGSTKEARFGMRVYGVDGETAQLTINGKKIFLRSEANCAVFPQTGYVPMDKESWITFFNTYRSYGINAVRFHSNCPPEAAFCAADEIGMYLQPELSCWDANSMFGDDKEKTYYKKEALAIIKEYANHPSFMALTFGNELVFAAGGYEYADNLITNLKEKDSTRLYSFASNGSYGSKAASTNSDFFTGQTYLGDPLRGIFAGMSGFINSTRPASNVNYASAVAKTRAAQKAVWSFEVGQFQVFPDIFETERYTGVLEPRNISLVAERAKSMGIDDDTVKTYINASGMLSALGYRMEIEAALRTSNMSGISLLGIQDFPGQSTALVGMMNSLGEVKPYDFAAPDKFKTFFDKTVALLETDKFCYDSTETFRGKLLMANYGEGDLHGAMSYSLTDNESVISSGALSDMLYPQGALTEAGEIEVELSGIQKPTQLKLTIELNGICNSYDLWVYPTKEQSPSGVYITASLNAKALQVLERGGKVLLSPRADKAVLPESINGTFTTAFWSSQFVSESQPGSMGLLIDTESHAFDAFPTDYFSNYQWWPMTKLGRPMILDSLTQNGEKIEPLVRVIDSFSTMRTMGLLYEVKVGEGKLMVSSMGLEELQNTYIEAKALRTSILEYMASGDFNPEFCVTAEAIQAQITGSEEVTRTNLAAGANGGTILLADGTYTCQEGYDKDPQDRRIELNDGTVDVENNSRSWCDWREDKSYSDVTLTAVLQKEYTVDTLILPFFEDHGCKAPATVSVSYWDGTEFKSVTNPSKTQGFVKGSNTIGFDAVNTSQIKFTMVHTADMSIALSEVIVCEKLPEEEEHLLTVKYLYTDQSEAAPDCSMSVAEGMSYSQKSPQILYYNADKGSVSGIMPAYDVTVKVIYNKSLTEYSVENFGTVGATILSPEKREATVIFARYDDKNALVECTSTQASLDYGMNTVAPSAFTPKAGEKVRVMVWKTLHSLIPRCASKAYQY